LGRKSEKTMASGMTLHSCCDCCEHAAERIDELEEALHLARAALWELGNWNARDKFEADPAVKAINKALRLHG